MDERNDDIRQMMTMTFIMGNEPVEICKFFVLNDDTLHIVWNEKVKMTDAARRFIGAVRDLLDNYDKVTIDHLSPSGDH